jgi:hypothetical protein
MDTPSTPNLRPRKTHVVFGRIVILDGVAVPEDGVHVFEGRVAKACSLERIRLVPRGNADHAAHARLHAVSVGGHTYRDGSWANTGPNVDISGCISADDRQLEAGESVYVLIANAGPEAVRVQPVIECLHDKGVTYVGTWALDKPDDPRVTLAAPNGGSGREQGISWRSPWPCRPTHLYARSDSEGALNITAVFASHSTSGRVKQLDHGRAPLPVELFFGAGAPIGCDMAPLDSEIVVYIENVGQGPRWVEIEMDVDAYDRRDPHCQPEPAPPTT